MNQTKDTVLSKIKWHWKNLATLRHSKETLHAFWQNPTKKNMPECYIHNIKRSQYMHSVISQKVDLEANILELGCNVGRNLNYLFQQGYRHLSAVKLMQGLSKC